MRKELNERQENTNSLMRQEATDTVNNGLHRYALLDLPSLRPPSNIGRDFAFMHTTKVVRFDQSMKALQRFGNDWL
jgi:hypothetical protein